MPTLPMKEVAIGVQKNYSNNFKMLDAVSTTTDGGWAKVGGFRCHVIEVKGIVSGDVVTLYGTLDDGTGRPTDATHRGPLTPTITADGTYRLCDCCRIDYGKARLTATAGGGTVTVIWKATW